VGMCGDRSDGRRHSILASIDSQLCVVCRRTRTQRKLSKVQMILITHSVFLDTRVPHVAVAEVVVPMSNQDRHEIRTVKIRVRRAAPGNK
ncbi:hypothetical protein PFISCL1PPCAC_28167, partial [Pristionchus fissidentatus]